VTDTSKQRPPARFPSPHHEIVTALGGDPCDLDVLISRTHLEPQTLTAALIELELDGHVAALPGGRWQRVA